MKYFAKILIASFGLPAAIFNAEAGQLPGNNREAQDSVRAMLLRIPLKHSIDGFEVNCRKTKAVVWGKPRTLNPSSPQDSDITVVDLNKQSAIFRAGVTGGIFGAKYVRDGSLVVIESAPVANVLDLKTGLARRVDLNIDLDLHYKYENCKEFPGKSYLKYPKY